MYLKKIKWKKNPEEKEKKCSQNREVKSVSARKEQVKEHRSSTDPG